MQAATDLWFEHKLGRGIHEAVDKIKEKCSSGTWDRVMDFYNLAKADWDRLPDSVRDLVRTARDKLVEGGFK